MTGGLAVDRTVTDTNCSELISHTVMRLTGSTTAASNNRISFNIVTSGIQLSQLRQLYFGRFVKLFTCAGGADHIFLVSH